jgi:hypothetical protein
VGFIDGSNCGAGEDGSVGRERARRKEAVSNHEREASWVGGRVPISESAIPEYDATKDPYCPYTEISRVFRDSPFVRLQRENIEASRAWGLSSSTRSGGVDFGGVAAQHQHPLGVQQPAFHAPGPHTNVSSSGGDGGDGGGNKGRNVSSQFTYLEETSDHPMYASTGYRPRVPVPGPTDPNSYNDPSSSDPSGSSSRVGFLGSRNLVSLRQAALEAVEARELLLRRLSGPPIGGEEGWGEKGGGSGGSSDGGAGSSSSSSRNARASMVRVLRAAALRCVETIALWHRAVRAAADAATVAEVGLSPLAAAAAMNEVGRGGDQQPQQLSSSATAVEAASIKAPSLSSSSSSKSDPQSLPVLCPTAFTWQGVNYLLKMTVDVRQSHHHPVSQAGRQAGNQKKILNPFKSNGWMDGWMGWMVER